MSSREASSTPTYLVVHPGAELYGSDRMALESVAALTESGANVVVALPHDGPLVAELQRVGADVVLIPLLVLRKALLKPQNWGELIGTALRGWMSAWRLLKRIRPAAVYVSTITLPQWPLAARMRRVPTVSHVHEAEASAARIVNAVLYAPHLSSRAIVVNSRFSRDTLTNVFSSLGRRATIVYNGVASPGDAPPARPRLDGPLRVLFLGRLSPRKGPAEVVAAAGVLQARGIPVSVTLLGSAFAGYEWFEQELREQAEPLTDVTFLGFEPDVWPRLAEHDVLVVPSRLDEPFGNTAVEGLLAGRVVVASDTSGLREAAGGYVTVRFVPPSNPVAIADALAEIASSWDDIAPLLDGDRDLARERHAPAAYRDAIRGAVEGAARG